MSELTEFSTRNEGRYSLGEEIANAVTHGTGALLSIGALVVLVLAAAVKGDGMTVAAFAVFGSALVLLFTMSTLYHALRAPRAKRVFEVLDHSSIYVLIAGTYTAFCLTALRGPAGWTLFGLAWGLAVLGTVFKALFIDRYRAVSTLGYVAMGWMIAPFAGAFRAAIPPAALALLIAGGVAYTLGAAVYAIRGLRWLHAVWHLFVLAGAGLHVASALALLGP
jgi:hemolysin III